MALLHGGHRQQITAVLFTVLLATSIFAGVAAGQPTPDDVNADEPWVTGDTYWQGQDIVFFPDQPDAAAAIDAGYDLYQIDHHGSQPFRDGLFNTESAFDETEDGTPYVVIPTSRREGYYGFSVDGTADGQVWTDTNGVEVDRGERGSDYAEITVHEQELDVGLADDDDRYVEEIESGGAVDLQIQTNRDEPHTVEVGMESTSPFDLENVFRDHDLERSGGSLQVELARATTLTARFDDYVTDPGEYTFTVEVPDTGVQQTESITVVESTPTPTPMATASPTPTSTSTPTQTSTVIETPGGAGESTTSTEATTATSDGTAGAQDDENSTASTDASQSPEGADEPANQPGFTTVAALMALLASLTAVLARRD